MLSNKSELFVEVSEEQQEVVAGGAIALGAIDYAAFNFQIAGQSQGVGAGIFGANASGVQGASQTTSVAQSIRELLLL
jgi:hypothetical protein